MAQVISTRALVTRARLGGRPRCEPYRAYRFATIASVALLAAVSGDFWLTGSLVLEVEDWMLPGSLETWVGAAILALVLLGLQERRHLLSRSGRLAAARSGEGARLAKASYRRIAEKNRGRALADTFVWRCAVHQRDGPERGANGLDAKA